MLLNGSQSWFVSNQNPNSYSNQYGNFMEPTAVGENFVKIFARHWRYWRDVCRLIMRECFSKPLYSRGTPHSSPLSSYISHHKVRYHPIVPPQKMENCVQDGETVKLDDIYIYIYIQLYTVIYWPIYHIFSGSHFSSLFYLSIYFGVANMIYDII